MTGAGTFNPSAGLLAAGSYSVTLRSFSSGTGNGFQDNVLGGPLDGKDQGNPGVNYVYTFSVSAPPASVGIPDFARGPSNTDLMFLPTSIGNGNTFNLIYTNTSGAPSTGTATITFSTVAATLQQNIQSALNALSQIGTTSGAGNGAVVINNPTTMATAGANVLVTFQNTSYFITSTGQMLSSTTSGVLISLASINVPNNLTSAGIPVALSNGQNITSVTFTLQYDPTLLHITGAVSKIAGASFTASITEVGHTGTAVLSLSSPTKISLVTSALTIGSLLATVPFGATATYGAKQLLHFTNMSMTNTAGTSVPLTNQDAVEVAAYFGDVNDTGLGFNVNGAVAAIGAVASLSANTITQTLPGFTAFPELDPVIIGSVSQQGGSIVPSDTTTINRQVTSGQPAIPWLPVGVAAVTVGPDPVLSVPTNLVAIPGSTVTVPVNIDTAHPEGSTGMVRAELALSFDPKVFEVSAADVQLGSVPEAGTGWHLQAQVNEATGQIGVWIYSNTAIESILGGSVVTIAMRVRDNAPSGATGLSIVPWVNPTDGVRAYQTSVGDAESSFLLHPATTPMGSEPGTPGSVLIAGLSQLQDEASVLANEPSKRNLVESESVDISVSSAVMEHVPSSLKLAAQLVGDGQSMQPNAILTSDAMDQTRVNRIRDFAFLQAPTGWDQAAEWLPDDYLAFLDQFARQWQRSGMLSELDQDPSNTEGDNLAGLETLFAGAPRKQTH
jgi:hypothetical protein